MVKPTLTDRQVLSQVPSARDRARRALHSIPHADQARYHRRSRSLQVRLRNGAALSIPIDLVPALRTADDRDLEEVVVGPAGVGLRWSRLDVDLSVTGLVRLIFGTRALMQMAAAAGGAARTTAKVEAARRNGRKRGRPRGAR